MEYQYVGTVTHYFDRLGVAVIHLDDELYLDDWIMFEGPRTSLEQQVVSMQVNREPIDKGERGEEVAVKTEEAVREGDRVYLILE